MSEIERLQVDMERLEARLATPNFLRNAPEEVLVEVVKLYKNLQRQLPAPPPPERSVIKIVRGARSET